ncbi:ion channel [Hymenobacter negativus]|uniref:Potassium channel domain-containing protein n=1 Tax=Hymenobacter negativus TaxID=2795026 RepID=A0ABS3QM94_9BACT|nr:ion channel [Hymenobacter negativus]MBO2012138.1 hypothetical protein [Hymenobacter negativus]
MRYPIINAAALFIGCILIAGALLFLACHVLHSAGFTTGMVLVLMLVKVTIFVGATLGWIHHTVTSAHHRRYMMGFLVLQMLLIVLSFGTDYYCLYQIDPSSFRIVGVRQHPLDQFLVFLYFSLGKYTTAGVGEIHPVTPVARLCAMSEMVVAYFTTVLIIANVGYLQAFFGQKPKA